MTTLVSGWADTEVSVRLRRGAGGAVRVDGVLCSAPVWFRWDGDTLWLVGSGASPVGEDRVRVRVEVGPGVDARVRSVAATVVYAARGEGTQWHTELDVADGASLDWRPEPLILTARARHQSTTTVRAASGARVTVDEVLVLGREGERTGELRTTLDVRVDGQSRSLTSMDTALPGWSGPAGTAGAPVVATSLRLDAASGRHTIDARARAHGGCLLRPAEGCALAVTTASDVAEARRTLHRLLPDESIHDPETIGSQT